MSGGRSRVSAGEFAWDPHTRGQYRGTKSSSGDVTCVSRSGIAQSFARLLERVKRLLISRFHESETKYRYRLRSAGRGPIPRCQPGDRTAKHFRPRRSRSRR